MNKSIIAILTAVTLSFPLTTVIYKSEAYAYENLAYYNKVKIGLKSMASNSMTIKLNGDYNINGQAYTNASTYILSIQNGRILFNNNEYDSISVVPKNKINTLSITSGTKTYKYLGNVNLKVLSGLIFPINELNIEDYLKGVVGLEMSDYFPLDALKAQAISARNYTLANLGALKSSGYDMTDTTDFQVYGGYNENYKNVIRAVEETKGEVGLYNDNLVQAFYTASNGGYSEDAINVWSSSLPYLKQSKDYFDSENWPSGNIVMTNTQIDTTLKAKKYLAANESFVRIDLSSITRVESNRISKIDILYKDAYGVEKIKSFLKDKARTFLSLPSLLYYVNYDAISGKYTFSGKGYGHGIGLSQIGAKNRAAAGQNYNDILKFYYSGSYIQDLIPELSNYTVSKSLILQGQEVLVNAASQYGSGSGYLYKFEVKRDNNLVFEKDFSEECSLSYAPKDDGVYTITVYMKDKMSQEEYDDTSVVNFAVKSLPVINNINITGTMYENRALNVSASESEGSGTGVNYKYEVYKDGVLVNNRELSSASNYSFTPSVSGSYKLKAYVKDNISSNVYDNAKEVPINVLKEPKIDYFYIDKSNVLQGQSVKLNTSGKDGSGTGYLYKYEVIKDNRILYTRDFEENNVITFKPDVAGNYMVNVYMKDKITDKSYDDKKSLSFSALDSPQITNIVTDDVIYENRNTNFNIETTGGSNTGFTYKYEVVKDGVLLASREFTSDSNYSYTLAANGNYVVRTFIKDSISSKEYDAVQEKNIIVLKEPKINIFNANKGSLLQGQQITLNASSKDGSGTGYLYKYEIVRNGSVVFTKDFDENDTIYYLAIDSGIYTANVYMKDKITNKVYDDNKSLNFTVYDIPSIVNNTISGTMYEKRPVSISSLVTGGSNFGQTYKFEVYKDDVLISQNNFGQNSIFTFTPTVYGSYTVKAYVLDLLSNNSYDGVKEISLNILREPVVVTQLPIYWGMRGTDVKSIQSGLTNLGYNVGVIDGIFGSKTYNALVSFQTLKGLKVNGVVDKLTLDAMNEALINK